MNSGNNFQQQNEKGEEYIIHLAERENVPLYELRKLSAPQLEMFFEYRKLYHQLKERKFPDLSDMVSRLTQQLEE